MTRIPLLATLVVAAAIVIMIRLGIWQLHRADEKEGLLARYAQNAALPVMALPVTRPLDKDLIFRRATALCPLVTGWQVTGGRSAAGVPGTRFLARCGVGAEGPGFVADMGVSADPRFKPVWTGGVVIGRLVPEPAQGGILTRILRRSPPPRAMLISEKAAPGLAPSAQPAPGDLPNNSWSYAIQWFFFAAAAGTIYALVLRRRLRSPNSVAR
jgi:surfeit locus 1 family protein